VQRGITAANDPGGKGVNVARAVVAAGRLAVAVLPSDDDDPLITGLRQTRVTYRNVPVGARVRINTTIAEPDGTTTKINDPGVPLDAAHREALQRTLLREAAGARWAVLSGSLPPGAPTDWYADLVEALRALSCRVAVDTSGAPLTALARRFPLAAPDLLKPNSEELAELVELTGSGGSGIDAAALEADPSGAAAVRACRLLVERGVGAVLATLGAAGAVLVTADGAWRASAPRVAARSTVGAGDSTLAGYVLADLDALEPAACLRRAVSYGSAAVALPGSAVPAPTDVDPDAVQVHDLGAREGAAVVDLAGAHLPEPEVPRLGRTP
jgi:1-phosphofructokinase